MITEATLQHFLFGIGQRPVLVNHSVKRNHDAGAVGAVVAMHQHRAVFLPLLDLIQGGGQIFGADAPSQQRLIHQADVRILGEKVVVPVPIKIAQIDDGTDLRGVDGGNIVGNRLLATVQFVIHAVQVGIGFHALRPMRRARCFGRRRGGAGGHADQHQA